MARFALEGQTAAIFLARRIDEPFTLAEGIEAVNVVTGAAGLGRAAQPGLDRDVNGNVVPTIIA